MGQLSVNENNAGRVIPDPRMVSFEHLREIKSVACGTAHTLIVSELGQVYAFGDNADGQLGVSSSVIAASAQPLLVDQISTDLSGMGHLDCHKTIQVFCSQNSSFALVKSTEEAVSDELYSWGATHEGILGRPTKNEST